MACDRSIVALLAALGLACSPTGGRPSVTPASLTLTDYEPARGATRLWASPSGTYLVAELIFVGEKLPAVIKVIERATGKVVAHARGSVVAGPDNQGEVLYVAVDDPAHPALRSTARAELATPLPAPAGDVALWSGFRLGARRDRVAVVRGDVEGVLLSVIGLPGAQVVATRAIPNAELQVLAAAASPTDDLVYLSGKTAGGGGNGAVVALDGDSLHERWRVAWPAGHAFASRPALGVTGDGGTVAAYAPSGLLAIDARRGTGATMVGFFGLDNLKLAGVPERPVLVALRSFQQSPEPPSYAIEAVELPSGQRTPLRPESGPPNPAAIVVVGTTVLVAPGSPPRFPDDPSTWGPELDGFVAR
jgi:hypothetical protein